MIAMMVQHSYGYTTENKCRLVLLILTRLLSENRIQFIDKGKYPKPYRFSETFIMPVNPFDAEVCTIIESAPKFKYLTIESIAKKLAKTPVFQSFEKAIKSRQLYDAPKHMLMVQLFGFVCHIAFVLIGITLGGYFGTDIGDNRRLINPVFSFEIIIGGLLGYVWYVTARLIDMYAKGSKILVYLKNEIKPAVISQPDANDIDYWRNLALYGLSVLPTSDSFHEFKASSSNELDPPSSCGGCG